MILERLVVGMLQTNCYLLADPETRHAAVIDPGGDADRIIARIQHHQLEVVSILNTHGHFDHVLDAWSLQGKTGGQIALHRDDQPVLQDRSVGLMAVFTSLKRSPKGPVDRWVREGDQVEVGRFHLEVLETPGHTPGHVSYYLPEADLIFVGDTLFAGSIGRTDFPGGSYEQLIRSVRDKIFPLAESTKVYPGHGPETTVGLEKRTNPFFQ
ncbi:MAG TPA: MBL fold metallo-hydrolase [Syntrophobacteraceae bacterium]|nr:MBL fold metallo-hydrolase [Syntrophobacteraceae bacterium]HBD09227.1 MBL fold metallo-hydrolase [Syntrophobacteraceae bacterium]HBZ54235.1 MBL fold metallo-hydrolase [Syntrophobacteraceae bacterium]